MPDLKQCRCASTTCIPPDDDLKEWIFAGAAVLQMLASQISAEELNAVGAGPLQAVLTYS